MKFKSPTQLKFVVTKHAIYYGANLYWLRTGARRCEAVCAQKECKWSIYAAWYRINKCFMVRRIGELHNCERNVVVKQATANFLATDVLEDFRNNRGWEVEEIVDAIRRRYNIEVSERKCYRARKKAEEMLNGNLREECKQLCSYVAESELRGLIRRDDSC
ncbi:hypothetical protein LINGRAHAP2_LOCUS4548 [Linum grandiflorum]